MNKSRIILTVVLSALFLFLAAMESSVANLAKRFGYATSAGSVSPDDKGKADWTRSLRGKRTLSDDDWRCVGMPEKQRDAAAALDGLSCEASDAPCSYSDLESDACRDWCSRTHGDATLTAADQLSSRACDDWCSRTHADPQRSGRASAIAEDEVSYFDMVEALCSEENLSWLAADSRHSSGQAALLQLNREQDGIVTEDEAAETTRANLLSRTSDDRDALAILRPALSIAAGLLDQAAERLSGVAQGMRESADKLHAAARQKPRLSRHAWKRPIYRSLGL